LEVGTIPLTFPLSLEASYVGGGPFVVGTVQCGASSGERSCERLRQMLPSMLIVPSVGYLPILAASPFVGMTSNKRLATRNTELRP
jgi:hypothetical protein